MKVCDYIAQVLGSNAVNITRSEFRKIVAPKIQYVSSENWVKVFSILWNKNEEVEEDIMILEEEKKTINEGIVEDNKATKDPFIQNLIASIRNS